MEKISGILPASPRTRVADISSAQPARPGALALGRPMGKNSLGDRITLSKQAEAMRQNNELPVSAEAPTTYKPNPEAAKLKVIEDLNQKFFNNPKSIARETDATKSEEALGNTMQNQSLFIVEDQLRAEPLAPQESKVDKLL